MDLSAQPHKSYPTPIPQFSRETVEALPILYRATVERLAINGKCVIVDSPIPGVGQK